MKMNELPTALGIFNKCVWHKYMNRDVKNLLLPEKQQLIPAPL